ncbi:serine/threonine-protein kinase GRIK1-like [Canna indica]|uniref:Serine/threonine-protein kinase GRIK1-like n=1 Tax=Canna indica TaxID=4628 RepID=A0AAQ3K8K5_9LILI|nr:serine/threonine-protein kinase GRIK1-like [Canna indica]
MSGFMIADLDFGIGCCGCLGFLKKADKEADSDKLRALAKSRGGSTRKLASSVPEKSRTICREKTVKETKHLTLDQDYSGQKMINEYVRECTLGRGSYGKVVLYRSSIDDKQYAIKLFYKSRLSRLQVTPTETAMTDVLREKSMQNMLFSFFLQVSIMKTIEHPNLINLIEVIDDPVSDNLYMVLEYVEGKSVCASSGTFGGIGEVISRRYLRDIISGLMYLHAHDIVHGDIKPDNLLVTKEGTVKIGDFSVSHFFKDGDDELFRSPGTPVFTAPECCLGSGYHGKVADVWAVGVTLCCMILGCCPFIGDSLQDTYDKIVYSPLDLPMDIDPELKNLLQGLLCKDPACRITLDAVADHPWVTRDCGLIPRTSCRCKSGCLQKENQIGSKSDTTIT